MSSGDAWHSPNSLVHHTHRDCLSGHRIAAADRLPGTGDKPRCGRCAVLPAPPANDPGPRTRRRDRRAAKKPLLRLAAPARGIA
jgi:hypothetical protein